MVVSLPEGTPSDVSMGPVFIAASDPPLRLLPPAALGALSGLVVVVLLQSNTQEKPWDRWGKPLKGRVKLLLFREIMVILCDF